MAPNLVSLINYPTANLRPGSEISQDLVLLWISSNFLISCYGRNAGDFVLLHETSKCGFIDLAATSTVGRGESQVRPAGAAGTYYRTGQGDIGSWRRFISSVPGDAAPKEPDTRSGKDPDAEGSF